MTEYDLHVPSLTGPDLDALTTLLLRGEAEIPEFRLSRSGLRQRSDPTETVRTRIEEALMGRPCHRARCLKSVNAMGKGISTVLLAILEHGGCDAAAWLILSEHVSSIQLPGPMGGLTLMSPDPVEDGDVVDAHAYLGSNCHWTMQGVLDVTTDHPETMIAGCLGRPLSTLVSHPALDRFDLRIAEIDDNGGDGHVVRTDHDTLPREVRVVELRDLRHRHLALRAS
jgi:hypothetical protein